jgi:hypothetical protein
LPETSGRSRASVALLLYFALTLGSFYPQSLRPWDTVGYVGDSLESVYLIAWNVHQFFRDPLHLFDANMLYPHPHSLTFTDHQLLSSLAVAPVVWVSGNPVLAYNLAVALACLFAAMVGRHIARALGCDDVGAWAAGALYGFHTYQVNEAPRIQILFHAFLGLALLQLVRYLKDGERRHAWLTALFMLLQALCSNYLLLYGCVILGLVTLAFLVARPRETAARLPLLALAGGLAALVYLPIGLPYVLASETYGYARELPIGIDLQHYVSTAPGNLLYGPIGAKVRLQMLGPHFVGFASLGLAAVAIVAGRRGGGRILAPRIWVPAAALFAALLVTLSLGSEARAFGHDLGPGPYRLLWRLPGFHLMRLPERLGLLAMLFMALLVARALTVVRPRWLAILLAALVPLEHLSSVPVTDRIPVGDQVPSLYRWLASQPVTALAEVPIRGEGLVRKESLDMYFSAYHWKPIVHGYASYPTQLNRLLRRAAAQFPSETALQVFARIGLDTVVVHRGRQEGWDLYHQLQGATREARFRELLAASGQDVFSAIPEAVESGRIALVRRFDAPPLFDSTADEVYRVLPGPLGSPAPFPGGHAVRDPVWQYHASRGEASRAGDGRLDTSWQIPDALGGDESIEVLFPRLVTVSGVVLPLRWDSVLPTRFVVEGRDAGGRYSPLAHFGRAMTLQLLEQLLTRPRDAAVGFAFPERSVTGIRLAVEPGGTSFDGWSLPELELRVP